MSRTAPKIELLMPEPDYAMLLVANHDWYQEALNVAYPVGLYDRLEEAKQKAAELDDRGKATYPIEIGGETFQVMPTGAKGGKKYIISNDDLHITFSSPNKEWSMTWRAKAAALWEYGPHALRERVYGMLERAKIIPFTPNERWYSLTRVDFAFDIYAPTFKQEMTPDIVNTFICPNKVKWGLDGYGDSSRPLDNKIQMQTVTVGKSKTKTCEVQIYNKTDEIVEASGKDWMYDIWGEQGGYWPAGEPEDVWRLEVRMHSDWLKEREVKDPDLYFMQEAELLSDVLYNRRLTMPQAGDSNRHRWPMHPLYSLALNEIGNPKEFAPVGRKVTGRRDELVSQQEIILAGSLRSLLVLEHSKGDFSEEEIDHRLAVLKQIMLSDKQHDKKIERAEYRYSDVEEAR